jgi:hypothetical protein
MNALVLNGARDAHDFTNAVGEVVASVLEDGGWETKGYALREVEIADCPGCGGCTFETPGMCVLPDAANEIVAQMARSNLFVLLTPLTFGGFSSQLKKAIDRTMAMCIPVYHFYHGELHHVPRYPRPARLLGIAVTSTYDEESARVFDLLVRRTALNYHSPAYASRVLVEGHEAGHVRGGIQALLSRLEAAR